MNLIFDIKKEPNKNKNINYNNNNNLIEKKNILQKNISILSSLNDNIINKEQINYNNNIINNYNFKRLSSKSNQNITTQSFKIFSDNNINNNNNNTKLTNSSFPNINFFFNNKFTENEFFASEKENNPFNITNDSFFNLNNKNLSQSVYKLENIDNNLINNLNNNNNNINNNNNVNNNNINNNNAINNNQKNIKTSQKQKLNQNNNINEENNYKDNNIKINTKFFCEHLNCAEKFKTLKQKLNHHKKMSYDCKKDTIHLLKNINRLKKIINILYNNKKIIIPNSLKEKYEKNIRKIPHHEYALLLTGYYLFDNL